MRRIRALALASALLCGLGYVAHGAAVAPSSLRGAVIAIDPGHGGVDTGAASPDRRTHEAALALEIALRLRDELVRDGAVVVLSRASDVDPSGLPWGDRERYKTNLNVRVGTATEAGAAAFVSLHMDSSGARSDPRRGPDAFYGPRESEDGPGRLLAAAIQRRFHEALGVTDRVYPLNVYVLRENPVPAALVECAFLNNPEDLARIRDAAYQEQLARAIALGIGDFLAARARDR